MPEVQIDNQRDLSDFLGVHSKQNKACILLWQAGPGEQPNNLGHLIPDGLYHPLDAEDLEAVKMMTVWDKEAYNKILLSSRDTGSGRRME